MQAYVEQQVSGAGAIYLQGAAGDINPRVVGGLDGNENNIAVTWAFGEEIGREVVRVNNTLVPRKMDTSIEVATLDILLPRTYRELFTDFRQYGCAHPHDGGARGRFDVGHVSRRNVSCDWPEGEAACPATHAYLMGYTNGSIGYFPEQKAFGEGGYEPAVSHLDPSAEPIYIRQVMEMLQQFH